MPAEPRVMSLHHPLVRVATTTIHYLHRIKARLPFLLAVAEEAKRISVADAPVRNDILVRMFHDSADMLVIDLCSLRERVARRGLFTHLHRFNHLLRRFVPGDFDVEWMRIDAWSPESQEAHLAEARQKLADDANKHFDWLLPDDGPVSHERVGALIDRFLADTKPTQLDRNRARAHRYEESPTAAAKHVQTLEGVAAQVDVFERYFNSMVWCLTASDFPRDTPFFRADPRTTAEDFTDLILLGNINDATVQYGVVPDDRHNMEARYWARRKEFFTTGKKFGEKDPSP